MGKQRKINIFISREGDREEFFLNYLQELFDPNEKFTLKFSQEKGGNSNAILDRALKNNFYPKVYAWFDEDDELDNEHKEELSKNWHTEIPFDVQDRDIQKYNKNLRKPIVIVSSPLSVEGILIRLFDKKIPILREPLKSKDNFKENKKMMKSAVKGFMENNSDMEYYRKNLTKEHILEKAKTMPELELLLKIFDIDVNKTS